MTGVTAWGGREPEQTGSCDRSCDQTTVESRNVQIVHVGPLTTGNEKRDRRYVISKRSESVLVCAQGWWNHTFRYEQVGRKRSSRET